jgi:FkbM family methyltransferase
MSDTKTEITKTIPKQTIDSMKDSLLLTESRLGTFLVYKNDNVISKAIDMYGEYCHAEINILKEYLPNEHCQYVDIGTNIGYQLVGVHKETNCMALGFEPNPKHFAVASYNSKDYSKIQIINAGASNKNNEIVLKDFDHTQNSNYGDIHITEGEGTTIKVVPLDSIPLDRCSVIKIDVEGHELEVLEGATKTISKYRPVIFYEAMEWDVWTKCHDFLSDRKYKQYWVACRTNPLAPTFKTNKENPFGNSTVSNILAVPAEISQPDYLMEVIPGESFSRCVNRYQKLRLLF